jgi:oligopeptide/dipeptide ABC transporter ATP-binding protein
MFQDPFASLNPRMTVSDIVGEPIEIQRLYIKNDKKERIKYLLNIVGIDSSSINRYPHEFSSGQRQRIGIARALAGEPEFIVADEPVSALDVFIRAQILNLLINLKKEFSLTYLFISHDLSVIKRVSDKVAVMYTGRIVEYSDVKSIFESPLHPYTLALISAIPVPDPKTKRERIILKGDIPEPMNLPSGCTFHPRCPEAEDVCSKEVPVLKEVLPGHMVSCYLR